MFNIEDYLLDKSQRKTFGQLFDELGYDPKKSSSIREWIAEESEETQLRQRHAEGRENISEYAPWAFFPAIWGLPLENFSQSGYDWDWVDNASRLTILKSKDSNNPRIYSKSFDYHADVFFKLLLDPYYLNVQKLCEYVESISGKFQNIPQFLETCRKGESNPDVLKIHFSVYDSYKKLSTEQKKQRTSLCPEYFSSFGHDDLVFAGAEEAFKLNLDVNALLPYAKDYNIFFNVLTMLKNNSLSEIAVKNMQNFPIELQRVYSLCSAQLRDNFMSSLPEEFIKFIKTCYSWEINIDDFIPYVSNAWENDPNRFGIVQTIVRVFNEQSDGKCGSEIKHLYSYLSCNLSNAKIDIFPLLGEDMGSGLMNILIRLVSKLFNQHGITTASNITHANLYAKYVPEFNYGMYIAKEGIKHFSFDIHQFLADDSKILATISQKVVELKSSGLLFCDFVLTPDGYLVFDFYQTKESSIQAYAQFRKIIKPRSNSKVIYGLHGTFAEQAAKVELKKQKQEGLFSMELFK